MQVPTRAIKPLTRLLLFVRAGGRCEFDGCNTYLLEHHLTLTEGNFAEIAHVVAFKPDGPRGHEGLRPADINNLRNLMLLCPACHKLIDDHPYDFSRKALEEHKERHESRIRHVTALGPNQGTSVLIFMANIGNQTVSIPFDQITEATAPRYPLSKQGTLIDLTAVNDDPSFLLAATKTIDQKIDRLYQTGSEALQAGHISAFALGPIPLLMFLGSKLSNKVRVALFQRHRDTENWTWKKGGQPLQYAFRKLRTGNKKENVAIVLSISGAVAAGNLPKNIDKRFSVYEIAPQNVTPSPTLLRTETDLDNFRVVYQQVVGTILANHGLIDAIHLFPAIPAPIAVLCGRELLPKAHPGLLVYDYDKSKTGFIFQLRIN